jgi:hypothetical protein
MTTRLPVPGSDRGAWAQILNDFLGVEHNEDGSLKSNGSLAAKYTKPATGIPKSDLDANVQASLNKADAGGSGGGSATAPNATTTTKGILRLSGDLTGNALTPLIAPGAVTGGGGGKIAAGTITDANINSSASISKSKLAPLAISDGDIASDAAISQGKVSGLPGALSGKSNVGHTHPVSDVVSLQSALDGKASTIHSHAESDITGLAASFAGKANTVHSHVASDVTNLTQAVSDTIGNKVIAGSNVTVSYDAITGETTLSAAAATGTPGSTTVTTVAGRVGDVVLTAGDINSGTFNASRIPNLDAGILTTGSLNIARVPTGTTGTTVSLGNHTHSGYAPTVHTHDATQVISGTLDIARVPTGTTGTTVSLGNHNHDTTYAPIVHNHDSRYYTQTQSDASLALKLDASQKGATNGLATLGADNKIPAAQLPAIAINETFTAVNQAAMLALAAQRGDICIRTDSSKTYILASDTPTNLADWKELVASGQVSSVNSQVGAVVLTKTSVGLGNVDNTSDMSKPVSTAVQAAINASSVGGVGSILEFIYISGAYPTVPVSAPAGIKRVAFWGPVAPTWASLPTWIGSGSGQIPATYDYLFEVQP